MLGTAKKLNRLLNYRERRSFIVLVAMMLFEGSLEMISVSMIPLYVSVVAYPQKIRYYLPEQYSSIEQTTLLIWASAAIFAFFLVKMLINTAGAYWKARFSQNRTLKLSQRLYRTYMQAPYSYHLQHNSAELLRNINTECTQLSVLVLTPFIELLGQAIIILAVLAILFINVPIETLLLLVFLLSMAALVVMKQQKTVKVWGNQAQQYRGQLVQNVNEGISGIKEIKLLGRTDYFVRHFGEKFSRLMSIQRYIAILTRLIPNLVELTTILGLLGVVLILIMSGESSDAVLQTATIFAVALARLKGAISSLMQNYTQMQHHQASLDLVHDDLVAMETSSGETQPASIATGFHNQLQLKGLWYRYPGAPYDSLRNINLTIHRGEAVGFVGSTGAGKSTLIDIVLGIMEPTQGVVTVDGVSIQNNLSGWHETVGYVPQMIYLVDGSIKQNIALGMDTEEIDEIELARAVDGASLGELIEKLPDGLETVIGERGVRLSGGQRQRVVIARALYRNPQVLILDEGTSALDNATEREVIQAVEGLKGERTILMIAHRLSTVLKCDRIVMLEDGLIEAIGTYQELLGAHDGFTRLVRGQGASTLEVPNTQ